MSQITRRHFLVAATTTAVVPVLPSVTKALVIERPSPPSMLVPHNHVVAFSHEGPSFSVPMQAIRRVCGFNDSTTEGWVDLHVWGDAFSSFLSDGTEHEFRSVRTEFVDGREYVSVCRIHRNDLSLVREDDPRLWRAANSLVYCPEMVQEFVLGLGGNGYNHSHWNRQGELVWNTPMEREVDHELRVVHTIAGHDFARLVAVKVKGPLSTFG